MNDPQQHMPGTGGTPQPGPNGAPQAPQSPPIPGADGAAQHGAPPQAPQWSNYGAWPHQSWATQQGSWQQPNTQQPNNPWPTAQWGPPQWTPPQPHSGTKSRRRMWQSIAGVAALVVAAGAGVGIGHLTWPGAATAPSSQTASARPSTSTGGSASNGAGSGTQQGNSSGGTGSGDGNGGTGNGSGNGSSPGYSGGGGIATVPPGLIPNGLNPNELIPNEGSGQSGDGGTGSRISAAEGAPSDISAIAKKVDPAIVDINVAFQYQQAAGAGTGIVLTKSGEVLTNNHVIDGATSISVTDLGNGKTYPATVTGYDPSADVAVLQLKGASNLTTAKIGDSGSVKVGTSVVGIGNAEGLGGVPSAAGGAVTALNRSITVGDEMYGTSEHLTGLIEVNADIESGDSGGPLVTASGAVVGMDTAASVGLTASQSGHEGFAIPINKALSIASTIETGHGTDTVHVGPTAALGVLVSTGSSQRSGQSPLPGQGQSPLGGQSQQQATKGALVAGVIAGGSAAKAGLVPGDTITSLDGHTVDSAGELSTDLLGYQPGQSVKIGWVDSTGAAQHATVTLGTGPAS